MYNFGFFIYIVFNFIFLSVSPRKPKNGRRAKFKPPFCTNNLLPLLLYYYYINIKNFFITLYTSQGFG